MAKQTKSILALSIFGLLLSAPVHAGKATAQSGFNLGLDTPSSSAESSEKYYLLKFQLQKQPRLFTPRGSFTLAYGSSVMGGEFALGLSIYPFYKLKDELRAQPFLGFEGNAFLGSRDDDAAFAGGGSAFAGVDFRLGSHSGFVFESAYLYYPSQTSVRLWVGLFYRLD